MKTKLTSLFLLLPLAASALWGYYPSDDVEQPVADGAFSVAWLTDTQYYTQPFGEIGDFLKMTDWVKRHQDGRNIQFLIHTGDITNRNQATEWSRAEACMQVLEGVMPTYMTVGNHDMGPIGKAKERDVRLFNQYFQAGDNPLTANTLGGVYEAGHLENAYYCYDYGDWKLLVLTLEFATRPAVVEWADEVIARYPDRKVILATHEFIDYNTSQITEDGRPLRSQHEAKWGWAAGYGVAEKEPIASGEDIWQQLICNHGNFILTINGHYGARDIDQDGKESGKSRYASSYRADQTPQGNYVHQILFNPQYNKDGGQGMMRLMEFQPDGETIVFRTFSPKYAMDKDEETSPYQPGEWEQFSINTRTGKREKLR
ncbi:MAG: metallophosphoesterase [Verrucomicrobiota bacterium JB022]|nr:metallophosphoesterase [Verrucomicrobiota bacterium JB022]